MRAIPARIHVLLARDAPLGVVIRRGPAKSVATLLWNLRTDEFTLGQWLRGRIYERRSDLSPDGKYLIVFAANHRPKSPTKGSWTSISRAPYLKAIVLLAKGNCWHGGGLFSGKRTYWLNDGYGHKPLLQSQEVTRDTVNAPPAYWGTHGEGEDVYFSRLERDGWVQAEQAAEGQRERMNVFEKPLLRGWILRKFAHSGIGHPPGKGVYWDEHALENPESGTRIKYPDWEWADWARNRLVWAAAGQIRTGRLTASGIAGERTLCDFKEMKFEAIPAPY